MKITELPIWRIGWLERAFFLSMRWLYRGERTAFLEWLFGFDISKYQGTVNFVKMLAYGTKFLILRVGYALRKDERFDEYIANAPLQFSALSVYHFYDPVYDPIQQANKVIEILAPHKSKIRRVWLDMEFWWTGAYSAPANWKKYRDTIKAAGYRIGWYTRATWWDSRVGTFAAEFAKDPVWAAQYNTSLTLIPKGWTKAMLWQKGTPSIGAQVGVSSAEIDYDLWNDEFDYASEWNTVVLPTLPYGYSKIRKYDSDVHIIKLETFIRALVTNTHGFLEATSLAAQRYGAQIAINGDGWGDALQPLSLAASNGDLYQPNQYDIRPFLNISQSNNVSISQSPILVAPYNLVSGTRYLVRSGHNAYEGSTDPLYVTTRHPRTAIGHTSDGKLVMCVVEGRSEFDSGVTLQQLADIMIEAGAHWAIELDGGGSSTMYADRIVKNVPSDGTERRVINHLLIFTENTGGSMLIIKGTAKGTVKIRKSPAGAEYDPPQYLFTGDVIEASENSVQWLHLSKINGVPVIGDKWSSAGPNEEYISWDWVTVPDPTPDPVPAPGDDKIEVKIEENGVVNTYTITGKLVKS